MPRPPVTVLWMDLVLLDGSRQLADAVGGGGVLWNLAWVVAWAMALRALGWPVLSWVRAPSQCILRVHRLLRDGDAREHSIMVSAPLPRQIVRKCGELCCCC